MFYDKELTRYENKLFQLSKEKQKIDYSYKSSLLKSESLDLLKSVNRVERDYALHDHINNYKLRNWLYNNIGCCGVVETIRLNNAFNHKSSRLQKRINKILNDDNLHLFITFTFDDKHLYNLNDDSKRQAVRRWLKKYCSNYVANVDYGGKNGRIHYHAVVSCINNIDFKTWKFGAINFKKIINNDNKRLALYVNKLTNHALKESTKRQVLIYKRNT